MLRRFRQTRMTYIVAALYALAVLFVGLAHRPLGSQQASHVELANFVLPDGTVPPICGQDGNNHQDAGGVHCEACALSSAPGLAAPSFTHHFAPTSRIVALAGPAEAQYLPANRVAPVSRGPPLV